MSLSSYSQMLPFNRTSFKSILHTSVGAAWYFHVIIVIIGHLILGGLAIYHCRSFKKDLSKSQTTLCNPLSVYQCPARTSCCGTAILALLALLRSAYYCIGPYAVSLQNPHFVYLSIVYMMEYICQCIHLTVLTMLLFTQLLILTRSKSISLLTTPSSTQNKSFRLHGYINFIIFSFVVILFIFCVAMITLFMDHYKPYLSLITGIWFSILSASSFYFIWISRTQDPKMLYNAFIFYSTSSSSSDPRVSPEKEAIESIIYYECHSGLPRCMTKTSLNEFFVPKKYGDKLLYNNNNNNNNNNNHVKQTSIHINDLEIVVEIQEPILEIKEVYESELKEEVETVKRESLSTISSVKIPMTDIEQGGYVADSEDNVKADSKDNPEISDERNHINENPSKDNLEGSQNHDATIVKTSNFDDRMNIRQIIVAQEYRKLFNSGTKMLYPCLIFGFLFSALNIYNGFGKYGAASSDFNLSILDWSIWLSVLSLFRLTQYILLILMLFLFRTVLSKIGETIKKTEYILLKQLQNRRGFRSQRRAKKPKPCENVKPPTAAAAATATTVAANEIPVYKCQKM